LILTFLADATAALRFEDLGLSPVALDLGFFHLRWYSLAYIAGILIGWWYLLKLLAQPGAPMARRHADDLVFYASLGIILGGRIGYVLFYKPEFFLHNPLQILTLWEGGMSFHGGLLGVIVAILAFSMKNGISPFLLSDLVAIVAPIGLFFGRIANFINGELWGRASDVPWAMVFPRGGPMPRHPSQLYQATFEGMALLALVVALWKWTGGRRRPGLLTGVFCMGYALARIVGEIFREPDSFLGFLVGDWLTMGMLLSLPVLAFGAWLVWRAYRNPLVTTWPTNSAVNQARPPVDPM